MLDYRIWYDWQILSLEIDFYSFYIDFDRLDFDFYHLGIRAVLF